MSARALDGAATGQNLHRVTIAPYARLVRAAGFSDSGAIVYDSAGTRWQVRALRRQQLSEHHRQSHRGGLHFDRRGCCSSVASPYDNAALVVDGAGSKLFKLT